jgi:hypothetical protein
MLRKRVEQHAIDVKEYRLKSGHGVDILAL